MSETKTRTEPRLGATFADIGRGADGPVRGEEARAFVDFMNQHAATQTWGPMPAPRRRWWTIACAIARNAYRAILLLAVLYLLMQNTAIVRGYIPAAPPPITQ